VPLSFVFAFGDQLYSELYVSTGELGRNDAAVYLFDAGDNFLGRVLSADRDRNGDAIIDPATESGVVEFGGLDAGSY